MSSTPVSVTVGFSDHNCVAVSKRTKLPRACPKIIMKRTYRAFNEELNELDNIKWNFVCTIDDVDTSLNLFMDLFMRVVKNHFNDYFVNKVSQLCEKMDCTVDSNSDEQIKKNYYEG